ncbi:yrdC domain-containing protein, mitochondrial-like isoform X2 [Xenia sp. Carnegie-2017]|nr:yrdC domain-containing protein, mitochondrial-like isoform X2 [Xenia sp. Carnegie-2017]
MSKVVCIPAECHANSLLFKECILLASTALKEGEVIALATDTVYGIAALAQSTSAVQKLYQIKGRNFEKPIAISVGRISDVNKWGKATLDDDALSHLLPGAVTLVFERQPELNKELNPYTTLVGIRIPDNAFIRELALHCDAPLALTSANKSSTKSSLDVKEFENLWEHLAIVFDGGKLGDTEECRKGSTVVNLSTPGKYKIIRDGSALSETIETLQNFGLSEDIL